MKIRIDNYRRPCYVTSWFIPACSKELWSTMASTSLEIESRFTAGLTFVGPPPPTMGGFFAYLTADRASDAMSLTKDKDISECVANSSLAKWPAPMSKSDRSD